MDPIKVSIPSLVNDSPQSAALLSKLNTDQSANQRSYTQYNYSDVATSTAFKIKNNESVLELLPDLELCIQIITASMLDPNGMIDDNLIYSLPDIKLPSDIRASILEMIKNYIDSNYDLSAKLKDIIREAYFIKGAYVEAIIPEASLDRLINKSTMYSGVGDIKYNKEDINHPDNILNLSVNVNSTGTLSATEDFVINVESLISNYGVATYEDTSDLGILFNKEARESFNSKSILDTNGRRIIKVSSQDIGLEITDDIDILRLTDIKTRNVLKKHKEQFYISTNQEAMTVSEDTQFLDVLFRNNTADARTDIEFALTDDETLRDSVSKPLVLKLPVESVIPVYAKSDPKTHV